MTEFEKGWWKCFNSFAMEILYHTRTTTHIDNVLESSGYGTKDNIEKVISSGDMSGMVVNYLTQYLKNVKE